MDDSFNIRDQEPGPAVRLDQLDALLWRDMRIFHAEK